MPQELKTLVMSGENLTVADFISSRPQESRRWLTSAASECLKRRWPLNRCELQSMARELRYASLMAD